MWKRNLAQRPIAGSEAEAQLAATQLEVLYNTWSPQNFSVETAESKLLWPGLPEEAAEIMADATLGLLLRWIMVVMRILSVTHPLLIFRQRER